MNEYFKVFLDKGCVLDFDKKCNRVKFNSDRFAVFVHIDENAGSEKNLALIPYDKIIYILNIE